MYPPSSLTFALFLFFFVRVLSFVRFSPVSFARSFVRRTNPRAFCFVSVCAPRRVFDVFTSLFFRSSASPRGKGKKREEKGVETSKTRPRGAGRFSRPKRGEDDGDDDARERARGARTTVERPVADVPRVFDETLIDEKRNENKHAPRAPRSRANDGWFSFVRSFEGVVGWG